MRKGITVAITLLLIAGGIYVWHISGATPESERAYSVTMEQTGMIGWKNGHKQWYIQAEAMTATPDEKQTTFHAIQHGIFYDQDQPVGNFRSTTAVYTKDTGLLSFPEGVTIESEGNTIHLAYAEFATQQGILHAQQIDVSGIVGQLHGDYLIGKRGTLQLTVQGNIHYQSPSWSAACQQIIYTADLGVVQFNNGVTVQGNDFSTTSTQADYAIQAGLLVFHSPHSPITVTTQSALIQAQQVRYQANNAQWQLTGQVVVANQKINAQADAMTIISQQITASGVHIDTPDGEVTADVLQGNIAGPWELKNHVTGQTNNLNWTAERAQINEAGQIRLTQATATWDKGTIIADELWNTDQIWQGTGHIHLQEQDREWTGQTIRFDQPGQQLIVQDASVNANVGQITGNTATILIDKKIAQWDGNVRMNDRKGNIITSSQITIQQDNTVLIPQPVCLQQEDGTKITGDQMSDNHTQGIITIQGHVLVEQPSGRWLKADSLQYDINTKETELNGAVESGKPE